MFQTITLPKSSEIYNEPVTEGSTLLRNICFHPKRLQGVTKLKK